MSSPSELNLEPTAQHDGRSALVVDTARLAEVALRTAKITVPDELEGTIRRALADSSPVESHPLLLLAQIAEPLRLGLAAAHISRDRIVDLLDEGATCVVDAGDGSWLVISLKHGDRLVELHTVSDGRITKLRQPYRKLVAALPPMVDAVVAEALFPLDALHLDETGPLGTFGRLFRFAGLETSELASLTGYALLIGALSLVVPISVQALVNTIAFGSALQPLVILGLALFAGLVISAILQGLRAHSVEILQQRMFVRVVTDFGRRIPRWDQARERVDGRELVNRFFDIVTLQKSAASLAVDALGLTLQTLTGLLLLAFYHPTLLAFDVVLAGAIALVVLVPRTKGAETAVKESKAKYATAAWLETVATETELFSDNIGKRRASDRAAELCRSYISARARHFSHLMRQIVGGLMLQVLASVALLVIGGWLVMQRQLTLGQLVASELIVAMIGAGLAKLGKQMEKIYDATAAVDKVAQVVNVPAESSDGTEFQPGEAVTINVDDLNHQRLGTAGISVQIPSGTAVAIVGDEASGKSSLARIFAGHLSGYSGRLRLNGTNTQELNAPSVRSHIEYINSRTPAATLTITEHLQSHHPDASQDALWQALRDVGLAKTIRKLPDGIDTRVLPGGSPLSTAQWARLNLARAIVHAVSVVVVDDALDHVDLETAKRFIGRPWTTIFTTRRSDRLELAQQVIQLSAAEVST